MEQKESIRTKLRRVILLTSACVLFLTVTSFVIYEVISFRRSHLENVSTIAEVLARACTSTLAFQNPEDAKTMLESLQAEPTVRLAVLYNNTGEIFAFYPSHTPTNSLPPAPGQDRRSYESGKLVVAEPVIEHKRLGTLYMETDLAPLYESLQLYSAIVLLVLASSFLLAYMLSFSLQRRITGPILELASVARHVSEERDYRVRAEKQTDDEIGALTEAFNHMLWQIAERDAALRESAQRLRLALESSRTGVWSYDARTNRITWDDHMHRLFGIKPGDFAGTYEAFLERVMPEDRPSVEHLITKAMEKKRDFIAEFRTVLPDGSIHYMSSRGRAIEDDDGKPIGLTGVMLDITESKRAEIALRESEERFRTMADSAPMMMWTAGLDKGWDYVNLSWVRFTGAPFESHLGNGWRQSVHPEDLHNCGAVYNRAFDLREPFDIEFRLRRADGEYRWVHNHGVPRFGMETTFTGYIGTCIDITEIKQAQTELERRVKARTAELAETNRELEAFTYSVSHDLRAPLRHINAYAQILQEDFTRELDEEGKKYLARIRQGARNMGMLVDDLLNLARVGRQELAFQRCDLNEIVREVVQDMQSETSSREIEWRIGDLGWVEGDPGLMKQVFANLLSNAVKYSRPRNPAIIEVTRTQKEGEDVFFVRDNGVGFNMKYANKLFGVFQRLHRAEEFEGTGVGLATVERIIRKHGGRIWGEGEPGKGAVFYFTLGSGKLAAGTDAA